VAKIDSATEQTAKKEEEADNAEGVKTEPVKLNRGGLKTKNRKNRKINKRTTRKIKGGLSVSGVSVKGNIEVIMDKLTKYIYTQNLKNSKEYIGMTNLNVVRSLVTSQKTIDEKTFPGGVLPEGHLLKYVEDEQRLFLVLAIKYFLLVRNGEKEGATEEEKTHLANWKNVFTDPRPFKSYKDPSQHKIVPLVGAGNNLTEKLKNLFHDKAELTFPYYEKNVLQTKKFTLENKTVFDLVLILADIVWNTFDHTKGKSLVTIVPAQRGGLLGIPSMGIKTSLSKGVDYSKKTYAANMDLNRVFDYSFKRMVYDRTSAIYEGGNQEEVGHFYLNLTFSVMLTAHFACSTATNIAAGVMSNAPSVMFEIAGHTAAAHATSIPGLSVLPPWLAKLSQLNTPQCYIGMLLSGYAMFHMVKWSNVFVTNAAATGRAIASATGTKKQ
jgi:hypothetical protein